MSLFFRSERRSGGAGFQEYWGAGGKTPGEDQATHLVPVFASIRHIVDYVSTLPVDFYRKKGDARQPVDVPELIRNVEDTVGLDTWFGQLAYGLATRGNAVGRVTAMGNTGPLMIQWENNWASYGDDLDDPWQIGTRVVPARSIAQVRWIVPPGKRLGLSPVEHFASMVRAGLAAQEYANVGRGGGLPLADLTNTALSDLTPELIAAVKSSAAASFASGQPFVHGKDWTLEAVDIPPNQLQFLETLKLSANGIASIYGIDPREVGGSASESLTYSTDESRALNRAHNMRPYLVRMENAVKRWIPDGIHMSFNIDATIRADIKTRTDVVGAKLQDGRLSVDEARALEDLPPVPGGSVHKV